MKAADINALTVADLKNKIAAEKENLAKLKFAHGISPIENPMKIRQSRRLIAQLNTALTSKSK
ncbi:MAG: 50S ribosomal protein L29 [Cytophagaceae bacterium]|jgi:large subunit ribosomal protein L29|nr:50S ribosomal protein L29 [Cytophagaceae bacterium]